MFQKYALSLIFLFSVLTFVSQGFPVDWKKYEEVKKQEEKKLRKAYEEIIEARMEQLYWSQEQSDRLMSQIDGLLSKFPPVEKNGKLLFWKEVAQKQREKIEEARQILGETLGLLRGGVETGQKQKKVEERMEEAEKMRRSIDASQSEIYRQVMRLHDARKDIRT